MQRLHTVRVGVEQETHHSPDSNSKHRHQPVHWIHSFPIRVRLSIFAIVLVCIVTTGLNFYQLQCHQLQRDNENYAAARQFEKVLMKEPPTPQLIFVTDEKQDRLLAQPITVLKRLGFQQKFLANEPEWDVLWAYYYPFSEDMSDVFGYLQPHQKVNHFPGTERITSKMELATSNISRIPVAFRLPNDKEKLQAFARKNPTKMFVQKSNAHRGIKVMKINDLDLESSNSFVQEFISNPLLVDGRMFDIGVYVIITSIDPLRVFVYEGEAVIRFCMKEYHPFDAKDVEKYVIGADYMSPYEIDVLKELNVGLGFSMKDTLNAYIASIGKQPSKIWTQIEEVIRDVFYNNDERILAATKRFQSKRSFFEMFRADFVVDENLGVYLMEVNFSPNLALGHLTVNRQRYEQLLFDVFSLVGVGRKISTNSLEITSDAEKEMQVCDKNLAVFPETCASDLCRLSCKPLDCQLCKKCWSMHTKEMLQDAYLEHLNRLDCKRLVPPTVDDETDATRKQIARHNLTMNNRLMHRWFQGKCSMNRMWCM